MNFGNRKFWKLRRSVYGLLDAARGFYLNYADKLIGNGCELVRTDPSMFLYYDDGQVPLLAFVRVSR